MTDKKATRHRGNCERVNTSTRDEIILPDWFGLVMGIGLGWPLLWTAVFGA